MKNAFFLVTLFILATFAGCFGDDEDSVDYSDFEGCTDDEEVCETEIPETENETTLDPDPDPEPMPNGTDVLFAAPNGIELRLKIILPEGDGPHPVIMWIHGGGWQAGDRNSGSGAMLQISERGEWAIVSIEYRLSQEGKWPVQMDDLLTALAWIRDNSTTYNFDPGMIVAWGSSAGGHLSAMLAVTTESEIQAAIDWYGPTDLTVMMNETETGIQSCEHNGTACVNLLDCTIDTCESGRIESASPALQTSNQTVPMLIMHGTDDTSVSFNQSVILHDSLITPHHFITVEGGLHGTHPWSEGFIVDIVDDFLDDVQNNSVSNNTTTVDAGPLLGTWEGERVPNTYTLARDPEQDWQPWSLWNHLDEDWNGTQDAKWILIEFVSTDCSHCWNAADDMEVLHNQYRDNMTFFTFAVNFSSNDNFNASLDEIAAFQDKTSYEGCYYGTKNCDERPGPPHNWTYVDDRDQSEMLKFHSTGTPMFVIIAPNGVVYWHQYQNDDEAIVDALAALFPEA